MKITRCTPKVACLGTGRRQAKTPYDRLGVSNDLQGERLLSLDSIGLLASRGNRFLLKSATPTATQIAVWDKLLDPFSRVVDPFLV
jgi:hypothetical protein